MEPEKGEVVLVTHFSSRTWSPTTPEVGLFTHLILHSFRKAPIYRDGVVLMKVAKIRPR